MTNVDTEAGSLGLSSELVHQLFDAAGDDGAFSEMLATRLRISFPIQIRAIQHRHLGAPAPPESCRAIQVHDRLMAWVGKKPPAPPPPFICGEAVAVELPRQLIASLRLTIVSMRRVELAGLRKVGHAYISPDDEQELVQLTIQELRRTPQKALPLATTCCKALAFRHATILNSLRRKLLELLSAVTAPIGVQSELSHRYMETVQQVLSTYALSELVEWFPRQLVNIANLSEKARRETTTAYSRLVNEAIFCLDHRFTSTISLDETARALHVSKEHLARRFKEETGETVLDKLTRLRIDSAKEQLTHSNAPLKSIASACGFGSLEHFQRLFKREVGMPPGRYRRKAVAE